MTDAYKSEGSTKFHAHDYQATAIEVRRIPAAEITTIGPRDQYFHLMSYRGNLRKWPPYGYGPRRVVNFLHPEHGAVCDWAE